MVLSEGVGVNRTFLAEEREDRRREMQSSGALTLNDLFDLLMMDNLTLGMTGSPVVLELTACVSN